ncbi:glycosyltransferase [Eubacterium oxidoreducens]|uniref:Glycosyl transferases group 1 n=1 Tax=Eubacterium oxidoreducens TaxID=1732 RepID=A0A1G6BCL0_EUBOX|nr:glycosyltransferase [Eubacterium oxidoreducens]SDB18333.1 Glycosyl transferases group 1 [Eubacterium oxidoreducens]
MKKLVFMQGGVETLDYFSRQLATAFQRQGYPVFLFSLSDAAGQVKKLKKYLKTQESVLITFNFEGLEKEDGLYDRQSGYLWDEYKVDCYNIAVDHPYYYHDRLCDLPKRYHHISIDRNHRLYFQKYYSQYDGKYFLPLAGNDLKLGARPAKERKEAVLFAGNYTRLSFFEPYIQGINEEYAVFYRKMIEELLKHPKRTVEDVVWDACKREMGDFLDDEFKAAMHKTIFVDMYVRNYYRGEAIKALTREDVPVCVIGKGWEELEGVKKSCFTIMPQTDSVTCMKAMYDYRLCLNVLPWFKDGAHDRIFNSILNHTAILSDESKYLKEELKEGEGIFYYRLDYLEEMVKKAGELLQNPARLDEAVEVGNDKIKKVHTWEQRAYKLEKWMEENE